MASEAKKAERRVERKLDKGAVREGFRKGLRAAAYRDAARPGWGETAEDAAKLALGLTTVVVAVKVGCAVVDAIFAPAKTA
jgi:hypothetical protein